MKISNLMIQPIRLCTVGDSVEKFNYIKQRKIQIMDFFDQISHCVQSNWLDYKSTILGC